MEAVQLDEGLAKKYRRLQERIRELGPMLIAFSGGVDSTLLAKVAHDVLGEDAMAVIADSESLPRRELREAIRLAEEIGVRYRVVRARELEREEYAQNAPNRCYFCKTELFEQMGEVARQTGIRTIVYGANRDDLGDYRPGMLAAKEFGVYAPLLEVELGKEEIRALSKALGLPTWDKPAFACLSSRFPHGTRITREKLAQVDAAEELLYELGFRQFRVRHHEDAGLGWPIARIEVPREELSRLLDEEVRRRVVETFRELGYRYVTLDLEGFRSGSLTTPLLNLTRIERV
ncbi:MAG: adenine nucleotide alpha hydrolase [Candidatus Poribacteria bacterium]|nr:MAG: adenine nucleotide alpha hydrolase [Candidatus Poribacteria bacterium]